MSVKIESSWFNKNYKHITTFVEVCVNTDMAVD